MNTELLSCLKRIIRENGPGAFDNIKLVGSVLAKNAAAKAQPECDVLMLCLMADYHKELNDADETLRDSVKKSIAERLHNNEGLDAGLCNSTLDILEAALFENEPVMDESPVDLDISQTLSVQEKTEPADAEIKRLQAIIAEYKEQNARLAEEITHIIGKQVVSVSSIKAENTTKDDQLLTKAGDALYASRYASRMRYLS